MSGCGPWLRNGTRSSPATSNDRSTTSVWARFGALQAAARRLRHRSAAPAAGSARGEDDERLARARAAGGRARARSVTTRTGPPPTHARPTGGDPGARVLRRGPPAARARARAALFCGGGWYTDPAGRRGVRRARLRRLHGDRLPPGYLAAGAPRLALAGARAGSCPSGRRLLELPSTHSLGMLAARADAAGLALPSSTSTSTTPTSSTRAAGRARLVAARLLGRRRRRSTSTRSPPRPRESAPECRCEQVAAG